MTGQHNLMLHLQKTHQMAVVQYHCLPGDAVKVRLNDWTVSCVALSQTELFFVAIMRHPENHREGIFWLWHVGTRPEADFNAKVTFAGKDVWLGKPVSLTRATTDVLKSKQYAKFDVTVKDLAIQLDLE
jgi:hypothetical protein